MSVPVRPAMFLVEDQRMGLGEVLDETDCDWPSAGFVDNEQWTYWTAWTYWTMHDEQAYLSDYLPLSS